MDYVVGKSFPKMLRRLRNGIYQELLNNLKAIPETVVVAAAVDIPEESMISTPSNERCLDYLSEFGQLNRLEEVDALLESTNSCVAQLYSQTSAWHFHRVLLKLCEGFEDSLTALHSYMACDGACNTGILRDRIWAVVEWGTMLRRVVHSSAIRTHLRLVNRELAHAGLLSKPLNTSASANDSADVDLPDGANDLEGDSELVAAMSDSSPPREAYYKYLKVLRLTVNYFQSVDAITSHLTKTQPSGIVLTTASPRHQGDEMLPWTDMANRWLPGIDIEDFARAVKLRIAAESQGQSCAGYRDLFTQYFGKMGRLNTGKGFTGTIHCEACVATFIYLAKTDPVALQKVNDYLVSFNVSQTPLFTIQNTLLTIRQEWQRCHWRVEKMLPGLFDVVVVPSRPIYTQPLGPQIPLHHLPMHTATMAPSSRCGSYEQETR